MKEGFTLVQEAFNSESFIGNQNTLFSQKHKLEESRKDRPSLFRIGENLGGKEKKRKKRIKPGEWKRKSKTQMEFLNLEAQKDENSKEGSERDQKQEKPKTPS